MPWYWALAVLAAANIPLYLLFAKLIFGDWREFLYCVKFWLTPDWISAFRGEYEEDFTSELRLLWWLAASAICVAIEFYLVWKIFYA
jgi:hypothetical protein